MLRLRCRIRSDFMFPLPNFTSTTTLDQMIQPLRISWNPLCLKKSGSSCLKISSASSVVLRFQRQAFGLNINYKVSNQTDSRLKLTHRHLASCAFQLCAEVKARRQPKSLWSGEAERGLKLIHKLTITYPRGRRILKMLTR